VNYIHNSLCHQELIYALYTKARVAMFTPLSEGMSLSAKEFILAQNPSDPGVLILSEFTGAAEQLSEAIVINPYDASETSEAIHSALTMSLHERKRRHSKLLEKVNRYDCLWWGQEFVTSLMATPCAPAGGEFRVTHYGLYTPHKLY
jgi:trehalose 6-phosphate synthase